MMNGTGYAVADITEYLHPRTYAELSVEYLNADE